MLQSGRSCAHTYDFNSPSPELKIRIFPAQPAAGVTHELYTVHIDSSISLNFPYIVDYKRYDADVFTGVNRRTAAVFQFHSAALRHLNKVGCQRYEGDYTRLKQKHAERRARRMAG